MTYDLDNPPWYESPYDGDSDKWGDEQDRADWFEAAAYYWHSMYLGVKRRVRELEKT